MHRFLNQLDAYEFKVAMTKQDVSIVVVDQYVRHFPVASHIKRKKQG